MLFFTNGDYVHEQQLPSITVAPQILRLSGLAGKKAVLEKQRLIRNQI